MDLYPSSLPLLSSLSETRLLAIKLPKMLAERVTVKVHRTLQETIQPDGSFELAKLDGLVPEIIPGF